MCNRFKDVDRRILPVVVLCLCLSFFFYCMLYSRCMNLLRVMYYYSVPLSQVAVRELPEFAVVNNHCLAAVHKSVFRRRPLSTRASEAPPPPPLPTRAFAPGKIRCKRRSIDGIIGTCGMCAVVGSCSIVVALLLSGVRSGCRPLPFPPARRDADVAVRS